MENQEIVERTNEAIETVEDTVVDLEPGKTLKIMASVGLIALVGFAAYKFVVKPIIAKRRAKKLAKIQTETSEVDDDFEEDDSES